MLKIAATSPIITYTLSHAPACSLFFEELPNILALSKDGAGRYENWLQKSKKSARRHLNPARALIFICSSSTDVSDHVAIFADRFGQVGNFVAGTDDEPVGTGCAGQLIVILIDDRIIGH